MQKRILVVDDDKMNLRRTSLILEKHMTCFGRNPDRKRLIS